MIIKNPYGFITKHYKIINLLLLIPLLYLLLSFGDLKEFFNGFVVNDYITHETDFMESYLNIGTTLAIIGLLVVHTIIYVIISTKKRKAPYHLVSAISMFVIGMLSILFTQALGKIRDLSIDPTYANLIRDISGMATVPFYILFVWGITKVIGFNLKTFKMDNNAELRIVDDDEEIEIKLNQDDYSFKRNITHVLREAKYYILENKFVFTCIAIAIVGIVGYTSYKNYKMYNSTFTINKAFVLDNFSIALKESYITNVDYSGKPLAKDKYYLAVKLGIENKGPETVIDQGTFKLFADDEIIYPSYDRSSRFIDIGREYNGEPIRAKEADDFVFVYELTGDQIHSNYEIRLLNGITQKDKKLLTKYKTISIRPQNIVKTKQYKNIKEKEMIDLSGTTLGNSAFKLNKISIKDVYKYKYEICDEEKEKCSTYEDVVLPRNPGNRIIIIDDELHLDENCSYYKNSDLDFYKDFISIEYKYISPSDYQQSVRKVKTELTNITPKNLKDKKIYEIPGNIEYADEINLIVKIRNQEFIIEVK